MSDLLFGIMVVESSVRKFVSLIFKTCSTQFSGPGHHLRLVCPLSFHNIHKFGLRCNVHVSQNSPVPDLTLEVQCILTSGDFKFYPVNSKTQNKDGRLFQNTQLSKDNLHNLFTVQYIYLFLF